MYVKKSEYAKTIARNKELEEENKKLNEKVRFLEECLDRKEKLNEEYRKEIEELKSDLGECECSMHFENDEVGYRKRECKKLKEDIKEIEKNQKYRYHRCMKAERGGEDED